ncbi:MAG: glycerol dehydrogenase [Acholeplasmatales bacterium]|nr:MAG: glycerol dehydrogenase [Acholeplasmatales bacterium]
MGPGKYVQGPDVLKDIAIYTKALGHKACVIADAFVMHLTEATIESSFSASGLAYVQALFNRECSHAEIDRLTAYAKAEACDVVIGIGGGKTLDTAKAVAYNVSFPVLIAPTIASTDAPTSALSVIYTDQGVFQEVLMFPANPNVVLVDTQIILQAPVRLLVSGMGDALATYFEARAAKRAKVKAMTGGLATETAMALAKLCYDTLLSHGYQAKISAERQTLDASVENVIEANTYLSGIGFESGGLAAAHAIHNGLTVLEPCKQLYHGEKVAFGTLVQLVLEAAPEDEIHEVLRFCERVGLPITLKELNIEGATEEDLMRVAKAATIDTETIHNMPFVVTKEAVYKALIEADRLGTEFKGR